MPTAASPAEALRWLGGDHAGTGVGAGSAKPSSEVSSKDIDEFRREQEIEQRLWMLAAELPGAAGYQASVHNLTEEMAKAKRTGDKVRIAATAGICAAADKAAG